MNPIVNGIVLGLSLSILVGPLLFALIQASLERGARAGLLVGSGIWTSDFLFVLAVYMGISQIRQIIAWEGFSLTLGLAGGVILFAIGLGLWLGNPPDVNRNTPSIAGYSYLGYWLKGFLINTLNPFTVFFWVSVMTTVVIGHGWGKSEAFYFFGSILGTIVLTDTAKVLLAKYLRRYLTKRHILWMRRIAGTVLILFSIVLVVRVSF